MTDSKGLGYKGLLGRASNTLLRLASLGTKLIFTLYLGRYLGLAEMGTYGLVSAYVAILMNVLGIRFDYVVGREIVDAPPLDVACKIRDQIVFYVLNYIILAIVMALAMVGPLKGMDTKIILFIFSLSIFESLAGITTGNIISLRQPVLSTVLFFIRSSLWTLPAMAMGFYSPAWRTAQAILLWWLGGVTLSLLATAFAWRNMPWGKVLRMPVDWRWVFGGAKKCVLIWLGTVGGTAAMYVDRFAVEHYLTLDYVGIASFFNSFVIAIQSLLQSSVFAFTYPRLISHYQRRDHTAFRHELRQMTMQAALFSGIVSLGVGFVVPILGKTFHRPEYAEQEFVLWLMLIGTWLKCSTEGLYYALYARHQDRLVWMGGLLVLIPVCACNIIFVPLMGFAGIGYSAIVTSVVLCIWRIWCVMRTPPEPEGTLPAAVDIALDPEEHEEIF